jgi:hypothetical protein
MAATYTGYTFTSIYKSITTPEVNQNCYTIQLYGPCVYCTQFVAQNT